MAIRVKLVALVLLVGHMAGVHMATTIKHEKGFEPMVAMYCGDTQEERYYNKYLSESGIWLTDTDPMATCAHTKVEVLEYCKKVYPDRDITNIVESNKELKLGTWCKPGSNECVAGDTSVRPYRCLEGPFQSDPLLVPEQCQFDHIHNQSLCQSYTSWNQTARETCSSREMILRSFAILLPCGVDLFSGVEFVCCPTSVKQLIQTGYGQELLDNEQDEDYYADEEDTYYNDGYFSKYDDEETELQGGSSTSSTQLSLEGVSTTEGTIILSEESVESKTTEDPYLTHYLPQSEHSDFVQAAQRLDAKHKDRVASLMKDWNNLKLASGNEKEQDEQAKKYQDSLRELEDEHKAERRQLAALHEQRVMSRFQSKKKSSISCLTKAMKKTPQNIHRIRVCAQKVMKALHKERNHSIKQFRRLAQTNPDIARGEMQVTLSQLKDIDSSVHDYFELLQQDPTIEEKVSPMLNDFVKILRNKDGTPATSVVNDPETEKNILEQILTEEKQKKDALVSSVEMTDAAKDETAATADQTVAVHTEVVSKVEKELGDKELNEEPEPIPAIINQLKNTNNAGVVPLKESADSQENTVIITANDNDKAIEAVTMPANEMDNEQQSLGKIKVEVHASAGDNHIPEEDNKPSQQQDNKMVSDAIVTHLEPFPFNIGFVDTPKPIMMGETAVASHAQAHQLTHSPAQYTMRHTSESEHNSVYVLSLLGTGLMVVIIIGIVLRKRSSLPYTHDGFIQVDTASSMEEQAVSNMQVNGYENPTYRYFETST